MKNAAWRESWDNLVNLSTELLLNFMHSGIWNLDMNTSSGIQTQGLTVCLYLNLKHGKLDHSATMAGLKL